LREKVASGVSREPDEGPCRKAQTRGKHPLTRFASRDALANRPLPQAGEVEMKSVLACITIEMAGDAPVQPWLK
jgi:hypothetical protein